MKKRRERMEDEMNRIAATITGATCCKPQAEFAVGKNVNYPLFHRNPNDIRQKVDVAQQQKEHSFCNIFGNMLICFLSDN